MSLLSRIKDGVIAGDWKIICDVYNMATGENLQPPVIEKVFDYKTATKKELLSWIGERREIESLAKKKIADLRDIAELLSFDFKLTEGDSEESDDDDFGLARVPTPSPPVRSNSHSINTKSNAPSFFINPERATNADKNRATKPLILKADLGEFGSEGTMGHSDTDREPHQLYTARCLICQVPSQVPIERVNALEGAASATTTCDSCLSKPRH